MPPINRVDLLNPRFTYTPDYNDPELLAMRSRIGQDTSERRVRASDEISRAGLIGSSASFDVMGGVERDRLRSLENSDLSIMSNRRGEAYDLFKNNLAYQRDLDLYERQRKEARRAELLGGLTKIAGLATLPFLGPAGPAAVGAAAGGANTANSGNQYMVDQMRYNLFGYR